MSLNMKSILLIFTVLFAGTFSRAQSEIAPADSGTEQGEIDFVERLLENDTNVFKEAPKSFGGSSAKPQAAEYTTLNSQSIHSDLAVIQKNYMPKTGRVQLSGGFTLLPSDVFFRTFGLNTKASYHFNETWGLEAFAYVFTSSSRSEVDSLNQEQGLEVKSLLSMQNFYGVNLYFNSIYGKTAWMDSKIIPFEIYQTVGIGKVRTDGGEDATSFQVGLGDLFSLDRSHALRVDLTWAFYSAKNYEGDDQNSNSLFLTLSYGLFWPEPDYR
ncbi:hypothetical protein Bb109J_c3338 [Bdellovibrio bacteriovorus]|nr:hypothetical protein Bb109J_c3338 [Bdellovibrio bacteriovorus]